MKSKKIAIRGLIVVAVLVALCMFFSDTVRTLTTAKVRLITPRQGKLSQSVTLTGKLTFPASEEIFLTEDGGYAVEIRSVKVAPGVEVEKGDVVMETAVSGYEDKLSELKEAYQKAEDDLQALDEKGIKLKRTEQDWADAYIERLNVREAYFHAKLEFETLLKLEGVSLTADGALPEKAGESLFAAYEAFQKAQSAYSEADRKMEAAAKYPIDDEVKNYISRRYALEKEIGELNEKIVNLSVVNRQLTQVCAPMDGYITLVNVKKGDTLEAGKCAYAICAADEFPVLRANIQNVSLTLSKGMDVTFKGKNDRELESEILEVSETPEGEKYADIELDKKLLSGMGGSYAASLKDTEITVQYRAKQSTSLVPASAIRSSGEDAHVYAVKNQWNSFGASSLVTERVDVTVLAEANGMVSVEEDLSYRQIAYMEDRAIGEDTTVMEYGD